MDAKQEHARQENVSDKLSREREATGAVARAEAGQMDVRQIRQALPHRFPFLLVDRILEVSADGNRAVGLKNVTINEPFFQGHFPDLPVMPGVLIVEALAQVGGAALLARGDCAGKMVVLAGLDNFRFRRMVTPGDTLRLEVSVIKARGSIVRLSGKATVDDQIVAEGEILGAMADVPQ